MVGTSREGCANVRFCEAGKRASSLNRRVRRWVRWLLCSDGGSASGFVMLESCRAPLFKGTSLESAQFPESTMYTGGPV